MSRQTTLFLLLVALGLITVWYWQRVHFSETEMFTVEFFICIGNSRQVTCLLLPVETDTV